MVTSQKQKDNFCAKIIKDGELTVRSGQGFIHKIKIGKFLLLGHDHLPGISLDLAGRVQSIAVYGRGKKHLVCVRELVVEGNEFSWTWT